MNLHAVALTFEDTDWKAIYYLYQVLATQQSSAVVLLNKAIAASYAVSKEEALKELEKIEGLETYYLYHTAIGEVYFALQQMTLAKQHYQQALLLTKSLAEQQLLQEKIRTCTDHLSRFSLS